MPNISGHYAIINQSDFLLAQKQVLELNHNVNYIIEPVRRNTAAACLLAALSIHQQDSEAVLCITPSDHSLSDVAQYQDLLQLAYNQAKAHGHFILLGAKAMYPSVDHGYLKYQTTGDICDEIISFIEKPDKSRAKAIHNQLTENTEAPQGQGNYRWNMGIFVVPAAKFIAEFAKRDAKMLQQCQNALAQAVKITEPNTTSIHTEDMFAIESKSIDQHFFVHCPDLKILHYHGDWGDIGTWPGFVKYVPSHAAHLSDGDSDCHFYSADNKNIFALGVKNLCLLDTDAGIFLTDKQLLDKTPDIFKQWRKLVSTAFPSTNEIINKNNIQKTPWGMFEVLSYFASYKVKILTIEPNAQISLQYHLHRCEHWFIIAGTADVTLENDKFCLQQGAHLFIPQKAKHRIHNNSEMPLQILEVQLGAYLEEDDIVRLEDRYGRS